MHDCHVGLAREQAAAQYGGILCEKATYDVVNGGSIVFDVLEPIRVKGMKDPVPIFHPVGIMAGSSKGVKVRHISCSVITSVLSDGLLSLACFQGAIHTSSCMSYMYILHRHWVWMGQQDLKLSHDDCHLTSSCAIVQPPIHRPKTATNLLPSPRQLLLEIQIPQLRLHSSLCQREPTFHLYCLPISAAHVQPLPHPTKHRFRRLPGARLGKNWKIHPPYHP